MKDEVTKDEIIIDYNYIINSADILKDITIERSDASNALAALEGISSNHSGLELNIDAFSTALDNINLNCVLGTKKDGEYHSFLDDYDKQ